MLKRKICACVLTIFFMAPLALAPSMEITLDCLADICQSMESTIFDVVVEYETYNDPPPKLEDIAGTDNVLQKGRAKHVWAWATTGGPYIERFKSTKKVTVVNEHGDSWDSEITQSYNGEVAKRYQFDGWPNKLSRGMITKRQDFMPDRSATPLGFTVLRFNEKPLSECLREKDFVRLDNTIKTVNGFNTIHVDLFVHWKDKEILSKRVYFSVDNVFTPVKIEYFSRKDEVALAVEVFELEKVAEELWFPKKGRLTPSVPGSRAYIYEASKIVVNQGLADEHFDIEFPPGTEVRDEINDRIYVVKSADE
jgi:hypothetical protein